MSRPLDDRIDDRRTDAAEAEEDLEGRCPTCRRRLCESCGSCRACEGHTDWCGDVTDET